MKNLNVMKCSGCGAVSADVSQDGHAWDGWQVVPRKKATCAGCIERGIAMRDVRVTENQSFGKVIRRLEPINSQAVQ